MTKLLVASDLHLSDRIWKHKAIEGDSYFSWEQIVDFAINYKVSGVVLAGDILDKQVNLSRPIQELLKGIKKLADKNIHVYFNQGQHEYQENPWMLIASMNNVTWLHNKIIDFHGWNLVGCDYQNEERLKTFLQSSTAMAADILICHQVWLEFMGENAKPQGSFADIPQSVSYLITGDYHEHIVTKVERNDSDLIVLSPGSTHLRSLSETEAKEIFLLDLAGKPTIRNVPLATRRLFKFQIDDTMTIKKIEEKINNAIVLNKDYCEATGLPEQLQKPVIQLSLMNVKSDMIIKIQEKYDDLVHLFFKPLVEKTDVEDNEVSTVVDKKISLLNSLDVFVSKEKNPLVYSLALAMLTEPDADQALKRWIEENSNV